MSTFDFVIIGAGPAGAFAAEKLATQGYNVALIESQATLKRKVCGEYLCPQGVALLKRNQMYDFAKEHFLPVTGMNLYSPAGRKIVAHFPKKADVQLGLSLQRDKFDQYLLSRAQKAGVEVMMDTKVMHLEQQSTHWCIKTHKEEWLQTKVLIGADGRKSFVAKFLKVQKKANAKRVAFHCYLPKRKWASRQGEMHIFANGNYIGIDPIHESEINFSLVCNAEDVLKAGSPHAVFNQHIEQSSVLMENYGLLAQEIKITAISPLHNYVKQCSGDNWALIGDASGFIDPLTGEGIYNALLTAEQLAEQFQIHPQHKDWAYALANYRHQRHKLLHEKSRLNQLFQWLIRHPRLVEAVARYLSVKQEKSDAFIGLIGNVYRPLEGLVKMIRA